MKKVVVLAAILAAIVTLLAVSASYAMIGGVEADGQPIPDGAPAPTVSKSQPATTAVQNQGDPLTGQPPVKPVQGNPDGDPLMMNGPAAQAAQSDPDLRRESEELMISEDQLMNAEQSGDQDGIETWGPVVTEQTERVRGRLNRHFGGSISSSQVHTALHRLGFPTSKWAQGAINDAYASGLAVGRKKGDTAATEQGTAPAKRQEAIAFALRAKNQALNGAKGMVVEHTKWDTKEHSRIIALITNHDWWFWWLVVLTVAVIIALWRRRNNCNNGNGGIGNQPGWANQGCGAGTTTNLSAANERCTLGRC